MRGLLAVATAVVAAPAGAQNWPDRAIRFIVPLAPGSDLFLPESPETFARFLANEQKKWAPVVRQAGLSAL